MVGLIITIIVSILFAVAAVIIAGKTAKTDKAKNQKPLCKSSKRKCKCRKYRRFR